MKSLNNVKLSMLDLVAVREGGTVADALQIAVRTAQQEALRREYDGAKTTYEDLNTRFRNSDLAQRSMTPDVRVLDRAVMPLDPVGNTAPKLITYGLAGGLGLGLALAFLLDRLDRSVLHALLKLFGGGPVGLSTLSVAVGEERETVEEVAEPFLVREGLLARTPRGRIATPAAWAHLGMTPPMPQGGPAGAAQQGLFGS